MHKCQENVGSEPFVTPKLGTKSMHSAMGSKIGCKKAKASFGATSCATVTMGYLGLHVQGSLESIVILLLSREASLHGSLRGDCSLGELSLAGQISLHTAELTAQLLCVTLHTGL